MASPNVFPVVYGGEEETSLRYLHGQLIPQTTLGVVLQAYRNDPEVGIIATGPLNDGKMDSTGGGMYVDRDHLEIATPEYRRIRELRTRLQANEFIITGAVASYMRKTSSVKGVGINRRVIDNAGNTFGVHDNFGLVYNGEIDEFKQRHGPFMTAHFLTRSFVSGAGLVTDRRLYFAQKVTSLTVKPDTYGYISSLYRMVYDEGGARFESRSNDLNILAAAVETRLGSTAIALALTRTPQLARRFNWILPHVSGNPAAVAAQGNRMSLTPEGQVRPTKQLRRCVAFQRQMGETFAEHMSKYGDVPPELMAIAKGLVTYCDDMTHILNGDASIAVLGRRADWAAKFSLIIRRMQRDQERDPEGRRSLTDGHAQRDDLAYDFVQVVRGKEDAGQGQTGKAGITVEKLGYGYRIRDRIAGPDDPSLDDVLTASVNPPPDTRAAPRARVLRDYRVLAGATWRTLTLQNSSNNGRTLTLDLPDPTVNELTVGQERMLHIAAKRPAPKERVRA
jgi:hypothetical protein